MGLVAGDAPHQCVLVCGIAILDHLVVAVEISSLPRDHFERAADFPVGTGCAVVLQLIEAALPWLQSGSDVLPGPIKIGLACGAGRGG